MRTFDLLRAERQNPPALLWAAVFAGKGGNEIRTTCAAVTFDRIGVRPPCAEPTIGP
jgi:hypothetical protein